MKSARVRHSGTQATRDRLPVSGIIRPGIKVLTKAAAEGIPGAVDIYNRGMDAGASFDDIERALRKAATDFARRPLMPRNAPYFSVRQGDFTQPGAAQLIMDSYAEKRDGDEVPHLYSFPVVFPSDDIDLVFRESFEAWKSAELYRWSAPDPETGVIQCMRRQEIVPDKARRKRWGGRPIESCGPCNPNDCDIFAAGECSHVGSLSFWVPGIRGVGVIELPFKSVYASLGIGEVLDAVKLGLGHIRGTYQGQPIFRVSKVRRNVSRINWETGKSERSEQWIIQLEADGLDMVAIMSGQSVPMMAHDAPQQRVELIAHDDLAVKDLRKQRAEIIAALGWSDEDLTEWMQHNGYSDTDAWDADKLSAMNATLGDIPF